jgi:hypothetical protein
MDSKISCINYPELEAVVVELIGEAAKKREMLQEFITYLEEHGYECVDGKSKYCKVE